MSSQPDSTSILTSAAAFSNMSTEPVEAARPAPVAIEHLITMYVTEKGKYSPVPTDYTIHDVVRVVEGTLADALPLLVYNVNSLYTLLTPGRILRNNEHVLTRLLEIPKIASGCFIAAHEDTLYGVVIKDSEAHIVGPVRHFITSINKAQEENCLIVGDKTGSAKQPNLVKSQTVKFDPENHILMVMPLGGYCFVQYSEDHDSSGDELTGNQPGERGLVLLVGTSFLLLDRVALKWYQYQDPFMQRGVVEQNVEPGTTLFMYGGGCAIEDGAFVIHGLGPRIASFNEVNYYALMHVGSSFKKSKKTVA